LDFWQDEDASVVAHCQVDGEFYKLVNPASATIKLQQELQVLHKISAGVDSDEADEEDSFTTDEEAEVAYEGNGLARGRPGR